MEKLVAKIKLFIKQLKCDHSFNPKTMNTVKRYTDSNGLIIKVCEGKCRNCGKTMKIKTF